MKLKLQPFEKKFLEDLTNRLGAVADEDADALFRAWRWHFGGRVNKATALKLPETFCMNIDFFQKSPKSFTLFVQNGNTYRHFDEVNSEQSFLAWKYSGFTSDRGEPIYTLYACTLK